ncbi:MAG: helix-turn-helix domain-containing protein, partial [Gemmatimonadota bacterium]
RSSVRELEGATIKLLAYSSLTRREITIDLAREALGAVLSEPDTSAELSPESIRATVAQRWGVPEQGLISKRRTKDLTLPRQVAMYLMRDLLDISLVEIGKAFGGRDHSTVIHSIQKVDNEMRANDEFRERVLGLRAVFAGEE